MNLYCSFTSLKLSRVLFIYTAIRQSRNNIVALFNFIKVVLCPRKLDT
jgi:hypothetical protein